jgi:hypothetical protein
MPALIGLPRSAWRKQPTGIIEANPGNSLFQELAPEALFVPRANALVDLMGKYGVDRYDVSTGLSNTDIPNVRTGRLGFGAWTPTKSHNNDTAGTCWRSTLFPSAATKTLINLYQLLENPSGTNQYVNGVHDGQNHRFYVSAAGNSTNKFLFGLGNTFNTEGDIIWGKAGEVHCSAISANESVCSAYYDGRYITGMNYSFSGTSARPLFLGSNTSVNDTNNYNIILVVANLNFITLVSNKTARADAMREFWVNPWQLFNQEQLRFFSIPTASATAPGVPTSLLNQNLAATSFRSAWTAPA